MGLYLQKYEYANYQKLYIYYNTSEFSLVPNKIENKINENEILDAVTVKHYLSDYTILSSEIKSINSKIYFPFPLKLKSILTGNFEIINIKHSLLPIINNVLEFVKNDNFIYCNFSHHSIQVLIYKNRKLFSAKSYIVKTKDEILYQILKSYNSVGLLPNFDYLFISGRIDDISVSFEELNNYIKNIEFINIDIRTKFSNGFDQIKNDHMFFDIYLHSKCE